MHRTFKLFIGTAVLGIFILILHFILYINHSKSKRLGPDIRYENSFAMENFIADSSKDPRRELKEKIVHLDLKGMPLLVKSYDSFFQFFKKLGVTGLLLEYEDMFPYSGILHDATNLYSYSPNDIKHILDRARIHGLQVIPLVQTFGHMEFVLKLEKFRHLREVPGYVQVICPSKNQTEELLKSMIDDIVSLHPGIKRIHIGSDEVYHIGMCSDCTRRMQRMEISTTNLFLQHVLFVANYVKTKHGLIPLMWDDEFRKLSDDAISNSGLGELVEIVVWNYQPDVENHLPLQLWKKYSKYFKHIWAGSAFKGADKPNTQHTNETLYLTNHYSWVRVMAALRDTVKFKGIVLTGWQRYDHMSVLCELLASSIPSLTSCMKYLSSSNHPSMSAVLQDAWSSLRCGDSVSHCKFPGVKIFHHIGKWRMYQESFENLMNRNIVLGWAQDVNFKLQFSNPSHIDEILYKTSSLRVDLEALKLDLHDSLMEIYPVWSVEEWMHSYYEPLFSSVDNFYQKLQTLSTKQVFDRRPSNSTS